MHCCFRASKKEQQASEHNMGAKRKEKEGTKASNEAESSSLLGNKGVLAIVVVVLISILANKWVYRLISYNALNSSEEQPVKHGEFDSDEFADLVNRTYAAKDLHKWTPTEANPSDPDAPGNLGNPVVIPPEKVEEAEKRFTEHEFNVVASELMSYNRTLQDHRFPECLSIEYPEKLPQTSVVIVFHNEAWSTLIRTLWSVYAQSPRELLREIILVDDHSDHEYLIKQLHDYIKTMPVKITMVRTLKRTGLIQARLLGAKYVRAPVITFLDAHCECNQGWLEPLLARVAENRQAAVAPVIDVISEETFEYKTATTDVYGSFNWGLTFKWIPIPERETDRITNDRTAVIRSPAMAGGLFSIDKEYFHKIGSYDDGMKIWGGENIEMSIRLWTCGGSVEMAQCSRVGHVFRKKTPYTLPGGSAHVVFHNTARSVDVWLDDYSEFYYRINPGARPKKTDVTERKKLRKKLKCKSFQWYLDNIFPESAYLIKHFHLGQLENVGSNSCIDTEGKDVRKDIKTIKCHNLGGNQLFMLTEDNEIRTDRNCLDATEVNKPAQLWPCHGKGGNQEFYYNEAVGAFEHRDGVNCLTVDEDIDLTIQPCDGSPRQKWLLTETQILE